MDMLYYQTIPLIKEVFVNNLGKDLFDETLNPFIVRAQCLGSYFKYAQSDDFAWIYPTKDGKIAVFFKNAFIILDYLPNEMIPFNDGFMSLGTTDYIVTNLTKDDENLPQWLRGYRSQLVIVESMRDDKRCAVFDANGTFYPYCSLKSEEDNLTQTSFNWGYFGEDSVLVKVLITMGNERCPLKDFSAKLRKPFQILRFKNKVSQVNLFRNSLVTPNNDGFCGLDNLHFASPISARFLEMLQEVLKQFKAYDWYSVNVKVTFLQ